MKRNLGQGKRYPINGLRMARLMKGLSQDDLGILAGVDQSLVSRMERGAAGVSGSTMERISAALGISAALLFPGSQSSRNGGDQ